MNNEKNTQITRRQFLGLAWGASVVALVSQSGAALLRFIKPQIHEGDFGGKVVAGALEEFQPGTVSHVQQGRFYLSRLEDGSFLAMWHRCTHLGCTVPWKEDENSFHCPCHSTIFNTRGEVVSGPAPRPLDLFPAEVIDGEVVVDTAKPIERQEFDPSQAVKA